MSAEGFFFRSPPKEEKTFSKRISSNSKSSPDADLTVMYRWINSRKTTKTI